MKLIKLNGERVKINELAFASLTVLKRFKKKVFDSIGKHDSEFCPMGVAFDIEALSEWKDLTKEDRRKLLKHAITKGRYESFIRWYDGDDFDILAEDSEKAMKKFLTSKRKVVINI